MSNWVKNGGDHLQLYQLAEQSRRIILLLIDRVSVFVAREIYEHVSDRRIIDVDEKNASVLHSIPDYWGNIFSAKDGEMLLMVGTSAIMARTLRNAPWLDVWKSLKDDNGRTSISWSIDTHRLGR